MGTSDTKENLLASWQIPVTTFGQKRYPPQVTGNLENITILDDKFVVMLYTLII